ncbi:MAG: hypothetical protein IJM54_10690 [Thermoguttaceae bacterium]|nr:hypothetical protein [Thermoguttaceae bacterium]
MSPNDAFSFQKDFVKTESDRRVLQWKYTSSRQNIEKSAGFFTFSMSERLTKEEKNELVDKAAHYDAPDSFPKRPSQDELAKFPVAFSYFRLSNGKAVVCRTQYVGMDYATSRYGNFFSHAFVLEKGDWNAPLRYFRSPTFASGLTKEEIDLNDVPPALPELAVKDVVFSTKPFAELKTLNDGWFGVLRRMIDGLHAALKSGSNLVFYLDDATLSKAPALLELFLCALPEHIGRKICFSTYVHNPSYEPLLNARNAYCFVAFAPSVEKEHVYSDKFVSVDLSNLTTLAKESYAAKNVYSRRLNLQFIENVVRKYPDPFASAPGLIADVSGDPNALRQERDSDREYLIRLGTIDELLCGTTADFRALPGVWKMLDALAQTNDVVREFVKKTLSNDYGASPNARNLAREILTFAVGFIASREAQVVDGFQNEAIRAACSFWNRRLPDDAKEQSAWRKTSYDEVQSIFSPTRTDRKSCSCMPYLRAILNDGATANDPAALWLALTLCVYAIVNEPGNLFQSDVEALAALVRRLTNSPAWKREFENVFFDVFATKILSSSSYDPFEAIFGMKTIEEVASSKFAECPDYWRKGLGVPMANDASGKYNPLLDDAEDEEEEDDEPRLTLVDSRTAPVAKKQARATGVATPKTRLPGADALVVWLINRKKFDQLVEDENLFGTFKRKHFKRARAYFGSKNDYKAYEWKLLENKYFPSNVVLATTVCLSIAFVSIVGLLVAFFAYVPYGQTLWTKMTTKGTPPVQATPNPGASASEKK